VRVIAAAAADYSLVAAAEAPVAVPGERCLADLVVTVANKVPVDKGLVEAEPQRSH
jgi:hypothetical protein